MKKTFRIFLGLTILVLIFLALFYDCSNKPIKQNDTKQIVKEIQYVDRIIKHIDTLKLIKIKVEYKYKTVYDTVLKQAPDTCTSYLIALDKECSKKDSINNALINDYFNVVSHQNNIITLQNIQIQNDSLEIKQLNKEIKKVKRKSVFNNILMAFSGVGIGYLIK